MKEKILNFIQENNLSIFNNVKTPLKPKDSIYKTRDAKSIHTKILNKISQNFEFGDTANILQFFNFTNDKNEIKKRQEFFSELRKINLSNDFLKNITNSRKWWKPRYNVAVVTEDSETFTELKKRGCPVELLISEMDVQMLESRDIVQIINCPDYGVALESLPQSVFLKNLDEVYLERHLEEFSGWIENLEELNNNNTIKSIDEIVSLLLPLKELINDGETNAINEDTVYSKLNLANLYIEEELENLTLSGMGLMKILSSGVLPENLKNIVEESVRKFEIPRNVVNIGIPLKIDSVELNRLIEEQSKNEFTDLAEKVKDNSERIKDIPEKLKELEILIMFFDFISGVNNFMTENMAFPEVSDDLEMNDTTNLLIKNPKPISFNLTSEFRCSILTGANSGGKTTLVEHLLQLISLTHLGLPTTGNIKMPLFEEVYYFAKNKGSNLKGAFETLLTQMSKIKPGNKTLILADEIEAVTEPGVAGNIIAATAQYYIEKNCFLVVATHLGHEIQKILPNKCRIDGIEAKGLTENFELIVDHNPVLGRLAHSTPELIVEKMAKVEKKDYFKYLDDFLKK